MFQWELGLAAHYSQDDYRRHSSWSVLEGDDPSPRQHLYRALCAVIALPAQPGEAKGFG